MDRDGHTRIEKGRGSNEPPAQPIRVAMLFPYFPPDYSGAGIQGERLARELVRSGVDVQVLCPLHPGAAVPKRESRDGLRIRRFSVPAKDIERKFSLGIKAAAWLARHSDWDLLHIHSFGYFAVLPSTVARWRGRKVLVKTTLVGADDMPKPDGRPHHRLIVEAYRRVDAVVALSAELEAGFRADPNFRGDVTRVPNGVDCHVFESVTDDSRRAARERYGIDPQSFVVMTAGRLDYRKRVTDLIEAAARTDRRPLTVLVAGPDSPFPEDRRLLTAAVQGVPEGVEVKQLGSLSFDRLREAYRAADAFVLASSSEGMPNSVLEAMSTGLPCLATDIPGSRDILADAGGLLFPVGDVEALAREIDLLARDPGRAREMGIRARAVAVSTYSMERIGERYESLYRSLLGGAFATDRPGEGSGR
jgi:glycosyltransferase involved in cell wall biosynthesis